jgi:hypothetical protein
MLKSRREMSLSNRDLGWLVFFGRAKLGLELGPPLFPFPQQIWVVLR